MDMTELIEPAQVFTLRGVSKPQLLQQLALRAAKALSIEPQEILDAVTKREALGSTGVGQGIAIPHARIAGLPRFFALFARLDKPIDFAAVDDRPVDLVFLLLIPPDADKAHLAALATVARRLRDRGTARRLRAAAQPHDVYAALTAAFPGRTAAESSG